MTEIPHFWDEEAYWEWIDELADEELEVIEDDFLDMGPDGPEISEDEIHRAVEHSGSLTFTKDSLIDHGNDIIYYSSSVGPKRTVTIPDDNVLQAFADHVRYCIVRDVRTEVSRRINDNDEVLII